MFSSVLYGQHRTLRGLGPYEESESKNRRESKIFNQLFRVITSWTFVRLRPQSGALGKLIAREEQYNIYIVRT